MRNIFQVLGKDLDTPSDFVVFWAKPIGNSGKVSGGTNTAVALALQESIPVFNMYNDPTLKALRSHLGVL